MLSDHVAQFSYPNRKLTTQRSSREMGAEYQPMLPLQPFRGHWRRPDLRNHRKLVVIDGPVAHAGSLNMIADNYHKKTGDQAGLHWHELMARFEGPIVRELDAVFVTDWYSETKDLLPLDYSPVHARGHAGAAGRPSRAERTQLRQRQQSQAVRRRDPQRPSPGQRHQPVLRARRDHPDGHGDGRLSRSGRRALRIRDQRPVHGLPCAAVLLRATAAGRGEDLPLPGPDGPARQAPQRRRRRCDHRLQQPRHPLPQPAHGAHGVGPWA